MSKDLEKLMEDDSAAKSALKEARAEIERFACPPTWVARMKRWSAARRGRNERRLKLQAASELRDELHVNGRVPPKRSKR